MPYFESIGNDYLKQVTLKRFKKIIDIRCSGNSNMDLLCMADHYANELIYRFSYETLGTTKQIKEKYKHPKDWFQAFKERFFPKFILRKFPVKYSEIEKVVEYNKHCLHLPNKNHTDYVQFFVSKYDDKFVPSEDVSADVLVKLRYLSNEILRYCKTTDQTMIKPLEEIISTVDAYLGR